MKIRTGYNISFNTPAPTPMTLMLSVHPSRAPDLLTPDTIKFDPPISARSYQDAFRNICTRITPDGPITITADFLIKDSGQPDAYAPDAAQHSVEDLPDDVMT